MEAVWQIRVEDFPAFLLIDDKGNDFFDEFNIGKVDIPVEVNSSIYAVLEFFEMLDEDRDEMITRDELRLGFPDLSPEQADAMIRKYDLGHFGGLNLDEFLTAVMKETELLRIGDKPAWEILLDSSFNHMQNGNGIQKTKSVKEFLNQK